MQSLAELLKYVIPALVMLVAVYFIFKLFLDKESEKRQHALRLDSQQITLPVRLQAYERLVLLLERIEPSGLLIRNSAVGLTVAELQNNLQQAVRSEFDHNLSQQLYVSARAWELVRNTREETIKRINTAAMQLQPDAPASELAGLILLNDMENGMPANKASLDFLKAEARNIFF